MRNAIRAAVFALFALGFLGGSLIVAGSGFTASSKRGTWQIFVPAPQAYIMAAILFALSALAALWFLQQAKAGPRMYVSCGLGYVVAASIAIQILGWAIA